MQDLEQVLREEVDRLGALPGSGSDAMLARIHRQRRRRTRTAALAALGVTAIAATAAGLIVSRPVAPPAPAAPSPTAAIRLITLPLQVEFPDPEHGFAIAESCPDHVCQGLLATTADGGTTWTAHPVPGMTYRVGGQGPPVALHVLDARRVALDSYDGRNRWFTDDAGLSWSQPPAAPKGTIAQVPPGGLAWISDYGGTEVQLTVLSPDGTAARLATPPATKARFGETDVRVSADGGLWMYGGDDHGTVLWHSRNRGRSWQLVPLPGDLGARPYRGGDPIRTAQGDILYAVDDAHGLVWRSTDYGRHWRQLQVRLAPRRTDHGLDAVLRFDGGLLLFDSEQQKQYAVTATGTSFAETSGALYMGRAGKRYLRWTGDDPDRLTVLHSTDGVTWTELRL
ncbi:hypothetical protein QEZ54_16515 [Catellatospora sp. KI3]|uniref:hypothetical protein n=1 Tax=Catellatospora sp. KI3 TaxID=3041620 RepID=UPI002482B255|nr:hypothetical protein [Catellatospora sp. KI3]MDI1462577.1 hypothetical protein [Catellatospora sp. KI3]